MSHKQDVLKLRVEGYSFTEIAAKLKCHRGTVIYHCSATRRLSTRNGMQRRRDANCILNKVNSFRGRKSVKSFENRIKSFQEHRKQGRKRVNCFSWHDVVEKFGMKTTCYLTGRSIDLSNPKEYSFDHRIPVARGGDNSLKNLAVSSRPANYAKGDMLPDEFIAFCREVVAYQDSFLPGNVTVA